ncbi:unnamed protein product [Closterium sp. Naga37s-1]|nr:unnamed protein product [Closterium sp. Naga37s-1]
MPLSFNSCFPSALAWLGEAFTSTVLSALLAPLFPLLPSPPPPPPPPPRPFPLLPSPPCIRTRHHCSAHPHTASLQRASAHVITAARIRTRHHCSAHPHTSSLQRASAHVILVGRVVSASPGRQANILPLHVAARSAEGVGEAEVWG